MSGRGPPWKMSDSGKPGVAKALRDGVRRGRRVADRVRGVDLDQLFVDVVRELLRPASARPAASARAERGRAKRDESSADGETHAKTPTGRVGASTLRTRGAERRRGAELRSSLRRCGARRRSPRSATPLSIGAQPAPMRFRMSRAPGGHAQRDAAAEQKRRARRRRAAAASTTGMATIAAARPRRAPAPTLYARRRRTAACSA